MVDPMQLVDELAMIYTTCFMCFATFSYGRSIRFSAFLGAGLLWLAWFITVSPTLYLLNRHATYNGLLGEIL